MSGLTPRVNKLERNEILNGNFDFWQRTTSLTLTNGNVGYSADRFKTYNQGTTSKSITVARSATVPTLVQSGYQSLYSHQFTSNTVVASLAATDYILPASYTIEGQDLQRLIGKTFTISFWMYSSVAGTYCLSMNNANGTRSYVTTYTISQANTWEQKFINITMDTVGPFNYDNLAGLNIYFNALTGSTYSTSTLNTWQSLNVFGATTATNYMATSGATFYIAQVMLNETNGSTSSNLIFHRRGMTLGEELSLCQRYYSKSYEIQTTPGTNTTGGSMSIHSQTANQPLAFTAIFPVEMRGTPTVTAYNPVTGSTSTPIRGYTGLNNLAASLQANTARGAFWLQSPTAPIDYYIMQWTADADF